MIKFLVLTLADKNFSEVAAISTPNKRDYARKHGYDFIQETTLLDPSRPASWNKILAVEKHLSNYDWIFWTDADSLVMNPAIRLEDIVLDTGEDCIFTQDENGLNAGEFFVRRSVWVKKFLGEVWAQDQFKDHVNWEQAAITHLLLTKPEYRSHIRYIDQSRINSYGSPYGKTYKEGDFIVHFAGLSCEKEKLIGLMWEYSASTVIF
jgi:mannan polymerase II complex MNN10 subunit